MFSKKENLGEVFKTLRDKCKGLEVLLVEDDPLIRSEYITFFGRLFQNIESRENGKEGLDAALEKDYDLIITDLQMPVMDGLEMVKTLKQKKPNQHALVVSAYHDSNLLHSSVQIGIDGYIFKPIQMEQSIEAIDKIVSTIVLEKENTQYKQNLEKLVEEKSRQLLDVYLIDSITKLYSLAKLQEDINSLSFHSLAIFKIKNFKSMNDFYGYEVGNSVLKQTADIFRAVFKKYSELTLNTMIYRVSGAHFAILAPIDTLELKKIIKDIIQVYESAEIIIGKQHMYLEMNAAIVSRTDKVTLAHADTALRMAERNGKIVIYEEDEALAKEHEIKLICNDSIRRALKEDRFFPFYHPIVDNKTNTIAKYEALARLILPDGSVVSPALFLPVSKQTKTYNMITKAIIRKALNDFRDSQCSVSLNLSMDDINHLATRQFLFEQIANFPEPSRLVFELLESENVGSYTQVKKFFSELQALGCKVAIDDFGSGYANFEHIAKLNVDYIKIDGSLIIGIEKEMASLTIVEMLAAFALKMNIKTIAEFVSSPSIKLLVDSIGIHESQGYLFGEPLPFNDSMKFIQKL